MLTENLYREAVQLLKELIAIPSPSRGEQETAALLQNFLSKKNVRNINRVCNNIWAFNSDYDSEKPTILLNSHHDTVLPNKAYTRDPYSALIEDGRIYGLGSNDAGASLVSLLAVFLYYYDKQNLKYNLCLALSAEEEVSGINGLAKILPSLGELNFAIVGEPTGMDLAIAERGLVVLDCIAYGKSGHAARDEGDNAIYLAMKDIEWFRNYSFPKKSELFGDVKMTVTIINAGTQHNVIPAKCDFTVDVRVTDRYTNEEIVDIIKNNVDCDVKPRSTRLKPSYIDPDHAIVKAGLEAGRKTYGSPTTSDQVHLNIPSLKLGPGQSSRSHSADEYVELHEIKEGIRIYIQMLDKLLL